MGVFMRMPKALLIAATLVVLYNACPALSQISKTEAPGKTKLIIKEVNMGRVLRLEQQEDSDKKTQFGCRNNQMAEEGDTVEIEWKGKLISGAVFEQWRGRGEKYRFILGQIDSGPPSAPHVIEGLHRGIINMCEEGERLLSIPPRLAFGAEGKPVVDIYDPEILAVPPNSIVIYNVWLNRVITKASGEMGLGEPEFVK